MIIARTPFVALPESLIEIHLFGPVSFPHSPSKYLWSALSAWCGTGGDKMTGQEVPSDVPELPRLSPDTSHGSLPGLQCAAAGAWGRCDHGLWN